MNGLMLLLAVAGVVSFKDAGKLKSWDAWDDHKAQAAVTNVLDWKKATLREVACQLYETRAKETPK